MTKDPESKKDEVINDAEKAKFSEKKFRQPDTWWSWVVCIFGATAVGTF